LRKAEDWHQLTDLPAQVRIGDVIFDRQLNQIRRQNDVQSVEPRLVRLLEELCLAAGAPVSRTRLLEAVSTLPYASDEALTQAISKARRILDDDTREPRYIRTIPRKGYALVAPVSPWTEDSKEGQIVRRHVEPAWLFGGVLVLVLAGLYLLVTLRQVEIEIADDGEQEFFEKQDMDEGDQDFREKDGG